MRKCFELVRREGEFGLDFILESRVTGEVFLLYLESYDPEFGLLDEFLRLVRHYLEIREWVRSGAIIFAGDQVIFNKVYC